MEKPKKAPQCLMSEQRGPEENCEADSLSLKHEQCGRADA
jgi:hypothetical protein